MMWLGSKARLVHASPVCLLAVCWLVLFGATAFTSAIRTTVVLQTEGTIRTRRLDTSRFAQRGERVGAHVVAIRNKESSTTSTTASTSNSSTTNSNNRNRTRGHHHRTEIADPPLTHNLSISALDDGTSYRPLQMAKRPCKWDHAKLFNHAQLQDNKKARKRRTLKYPLPVAHSDIPHDGMMLTNNETVLVLYQMMRDIHDVFSQSNVKYYITGGTLLGAVRHKGIIPWDDDLDLSVADDDFDNILGLRDTFESLGYDLIVYGGGFKIFPLQGCAVPGRHFLYPFADVFLVGYDPKGRTILTRTKRFSRCYFKLDELQPLRLLQFGDMQVYSAHDPLSYLDRCFGDWRTVGAAGTDHLTYTDLSNLYRPLDDLPRGPAQPTGPLLTRVHNGQVDDMW